jgi:endonuclease YncB( thermonuclease family)
MPFTLIKGKFVPKAGTPDGDSVRFKANDPIYWLKLKGRTVDINFDNRTVQTRFEGIDALEKGAKKPLSVDAKNSLLSLINYDKSTNQQPAGYLLSRMVDPHGRPICFAFSGTTDSKDGSDIFLDQEMVRNSVNYKQMAAGLAYPLYYDTLFADLREAFNEALYSAKQSSMGYWPTDATLSGVTVRGTGSLSTIDPIWPKLWRRLDEYLHNHQNLDDFLAWLDAKGERVDILSTMERKGLEDVFKVQGNSVSLTESPENLRVVSIASPGTHLFEDPLKIAQGLLP